LFAVVTEISLNILQVLRKLLLGAIAPKKHPITEILSDKALQLHYSLFDN